MNAEEVSVWFGIVIHMGGGRGGGVHSSPAGADYRQLNPAHPISDYLHEPDSLRTDQEMAHAQIPPDELTVAPTGRRLWHAQS